MPVEIRHKKQIRSLIRQETITLAGNRRLKIYGRLDCASGKRMKAANRVFFRGEADARASGYRPCGHCMPQRYRKWKSAQAAP